MRYLRYLALLACCVSPALAALEFAESRIDLKTTPGQKSVDANYSFRNTGTGVVKVTDITTSCGCTVPELPKREFAPGEAGVLKVRFDIGDRQGLQSKTITVRTDAGEHLLQLVADIPLRILMTPRLVVFRPGEPGEREVKLEFRADAPVSKVRISDVTQPFEVALRTDVEGKDYTVLVRLKTLPGTDARTTVFVYSTTASGIEYNDAFFLRFAP